MVIANIVPPEGSWTWVDGSVAVFKDGVLEARPIGAKQSSLTTANSSFELRNKLVNFQASLKIEPLSDTDFVAALRLAAQSLNAYATVLEDPNATDAELAGAAEAAKRDVLGPLNDLSVVGLEVPDELFLGPTQCVLAQRSVVQGYVPPHVHKYPVCG